jgi:glycosyltransferase involved in cell wall biosynthesis
MHVLMVSTEYPPMPGGVGRYTANLTKAIRKTGARVDVVCSKEGDGQFSGISPTNKQNSDVLLKIVDETKPDVVHVQFEPGMYGLQLDMKDPRNSGTYIDAFYRQCKVPIVTTFHTGFALGQWLSHASLVKKTGRTGRLGIPLRASIRLWKYSLNYKAFADLNRDKRIQSKAGIAFSRHLSKMLRKDCDIIYHGSEPAPNVSPSKQEARAYFGLPQERRIALAVGFRTVTKGWDTLQQLNLPKGWILVTNSSKGHYNTETLELKWKKDGGHNADEGTRVIDLERGFLDEKELSLLFYASDIMLLPYKVTAGSGVMFDGIAHGLPFVSSDLRFFKEFAAMGLGIATKRDPRKFENAIAKLDSDYDKYAKRVGEFSKKLRWDYVAKQHLAVYESVSHNG